MVASGKYIDLISLPSIYSRVVEVTAISLQDVFLRHLVLFVDLDKSKISFPVHAEWLKSNREGWIRYWATEVWPVAHMNIDDIFLKLLKKA